ncbi:hypothetical protein F4679DRAFT_585253 [Xylaria curta]|nr:hypothetical protein F4679DRAFT_585253 [Xylaria curta]
MTPITLYPYTPSMSLRSSGPGHFLSNRWLDKPVQFVVAAKGLSADVHEHSKIDGLDIRNLIIGALMSRGASFKPTRRPEGDFLVRGLPFTRCPPLPSTSATMREFLVVTLAEK